MEKCTSQSAVKRRAAISVTSQSSAGSRFSPVRALVATTRQWCERTEASESASATAPASSAPGRSRLFASTNSVAPASRCNATKYCIYSTVMFTRHERERERERNYCHKIIKKYLFDKKTAKFPSAIIET